MRILLFLTFIPFLAAVIHDVYINLTDKDKLRDLKNLRPDIDDFLISDLGWVWNEYAPNALEVFKDSFSVETWDSLINPVLQMPTMLVTLIPFAILFALSIVLNIFNKIQNRDFTPPKSEEYSVYKTAKPMKYKRK